MKPKLSSRSRRLRYASASWNSARAKTLLGRLLLYSASSLAMVPCFQAAYLATIASSLLACVFVSAGSVSEIRVVTLHPGVSSGQWEAVLATGEPAGGAGKKLDFLAGSARLSADAEQAGPGLLRFRLDGVPPDARQIGVVEAWQKEGSPLAAISIRAAHQSDAPFNDWIIYHIMVEMFRNGDPSNDNELTGWRHPNYASGDLQGVLQSLDYIRFIGANAIWLSPIFACDTSHGYDVKNYYLIGDAVGVPVDHKASLDLFRRLVSEAHSKGIRIILDLPLNHASKLYQLPDGDPQGLHPRATGPKQDAEKLWDSWGAGYQYWDLDDPNTRRFLIEAALYWLRDMNVDGLRLDYARGVPHDFWSQLYAEVKKVKPGAFLMGECWNDAERQEANARDIATYYEPVSGTPQFDSLLDFPVQMTMTAAFARGDPVLDIETWLQRTAAEYSAGATPAFFLDNHDLARFMSWTGEQDRLVAAIRFLSSLSGPIVVFYGTETGIIHTRPSEGVLDSGRIPMPWQDLDSQLVGRVRQALQTRSAHSDVLARGARLPLFADKDVLVMAKVSPEETALVGVNLSKAARDVEFDATGIIPKGAGLKAMLGDSAPQATNQAGRMKWVLAAHNTCMAIATSSNRPLTPISPVAPLASVISLPAAPKKPAVTADSMAEGRIVFDKVIESLGGNEKVASVRDIRFKATGIDKGHRGMVDMKIVVSRLLPDRIRQDIEFPMMKFVLLVSSEACIEIIGSETRVLSGLEADECRRVFKISPITAANALAGGKVELNCAGTEKIDDVQADILDVTYDGAEARWFVDPSNGRILRERFHCITTYGPADYQIDSSDWRRVDGMWVAYSRVISANGELVGAYTIDDYEVNVNLDPALFESPVGKTE
ncbi:MAG: alpha-amylase family glycosyl hydrolase [Acidobacteriota bacterium]